MTPFVERRFELDDGKVVARFHMPAQAPSGEYRCQWFLDWPDRQLSGKVCGEDGVQALMLAMKYVHLQLVESEAYRSGKLTLWEQADLDLPPTWGAGPLYFIPDRI